MRRLAPYVAASVGAHLAGLLLLSGALSRPAEDGASVLEVTALIRSAEAAEAPSPDERQDEHEPAEPEAPPRRPAPRRRPEAVEPEPPSPAPEPAPEVEARAATDLAGGTAGAGLAPPASRDPAAPAPPGQAAPAVASAAGGSAGPGGPGRGSAARGRAEPDPCALLPAAVSGGLRGTPYPAAVQALRLTGLVQVNLRVGRDGRPRGVRIVGSSGHEALDLHTLAAVRRLGGLPACGRSVTVPVRYRLGR